MRREEALKFVGTNAEDENLLKYMVATESIMRDLAKDVCRS